MYDALNQYFCQLRSMNTCKLPHACSAFRKDATRVPNEPNSKGGGRGRGCRYGFKYGCRPTRKKIVTDMEIRILKILKKIDTDLEIRILKILKKIGTDLEIRILGGFFYFGPKWGVF